METMMTIIKKVAEAGVNSGFTADEATKAFEKYFCHYDFFEEMLDEFEETMIEENQLDRFADDTYLIDNQEFVKKCHLRWRNRERKYARKPTLSLKERL